MKYILTDDFYQAMILVLNNAELDLEDLPPELIAYFRGKRDAYKEALQIFGRYAIVENKSC